MKSILKYEILKSIKNKSFVIISIISMLILMGIFQIGFNYSQLGLSKSNNSEKGYSDLYNEVSSKHEGEFSDEKVKEILADFMNRYQSEADVNQRPFDLFSWNIAEVFFPTDVDVYIKMNEAIQKNEKITVNQIDIKKINDVGFKTFDSPLVIGSYNNWSDLYSVLGMIFILISIITIIICSPIFSGEVSSNINQLLMTTKHGRGKLILSKIASSLIIPISIFLIIQAITFLFFNFFHSGMGGWNASIQTNFSLLFFEFPLEITHLQIYFLIILFQFFSLISVISVTVFVSAFSKSTFTSLLVGVGSFLLPLGLIQLFKDGFLNQLLYVFPINVSDPIKMLSVFSTNNGFIFNSFVSNIILSICLFIISAVILNICLFFKVKKSFY